MTPAMLHRRRPPAAPTGVDWAPATGRELGSEQLPDMPPAPYRLVACLNVWNDRAALEHTVHTWYPHVDRVIAVDGEYGASDVSGVGGSLSSDGTREFLLALPEAATKVALLDAAGLTQCAKRTRYCDAAREGDLLVILDADESVIHPNLLRRAPWLDVGWMRIVSPLYAKPYGQPRVVRWQPGLRYAGRHHWLYLGDSLLATHQYGGAGFEHRCVPVTITNDRGLGHSGTRHVAKRQLLGAQLAHEALEQAGPHTGASDRLVGRRETLRIATVALRDDGIAPSRLHTAINRTTPHASLFVSGKPGPFESPDQFLISRDLELSARFLREAEVVHYHVDVPRELPRPRPHQHVVLHHHGSPLRRNPAHFAQLAASLKALVLVSNVQLLTYAEPARFLPNAMPVARYRRLRTIHAPLSVEPFRVAHSPSRPAIKATGVFNRVCHRLRERGYPIEPVLIFGQPHHESLRLKATCHAAFDSFWLGMQCSGLEAAAMGLPVIAGDATVADRHREQFGLVPYTFADSEDELETVLARLVDDAEFRQAEAGRVASFVTEYHDESAVALRYLDYLDEAFAWRSKR